MVLSLACHEPLGLQSLTAFAMPEVLSSMRLVTSQTSHKHSQILADYDSFSGLADVQP